MSTEKARLFKRGSKYDIYLSSRASDTLDELVNNHKDGRSQKALANLFVRMTKHADGHKLHKPEQLNSEGDSFYAYKNKRGFRAYFWWCGTNKNTILISHFVYKKKTELSKSDKETMKKEREKYSKGWEEVKEG